MASGSMPLRKVSAPNDADSCQRRAAATPSWPVGFAVPADVEVREVDLAVELQILAFHEQRRLDEAAPTTPYPPSLGEAINA